MFIVTAKVEAWEEDFPGSRVKWVVGQSREVHDSLVDKFRNNPAAWTVSGGSDSSPMQVTKTVTGGIGLSETGIAAVNSTLDAVKVPRHTIGLNGVVNKMRMLQGAGADEYHLAAIKSALQPLIRSSAWEKIRELWVPTGSSLAASLVKIKAAYNAVPNTSMNSVNFVEADYVPNIGLIGDGATKYIFTHSTPSDAYKTASDTAGCTVKNYGFAVYPTSPSHSPLGYLAGASNGPNSRLLGGNGALGGGEAMGSTALNREVSSGTQSGYRCRMQFVQSFGGNTQAGTGGLIEAQIAATETVVGTAKVFIFVPNNGSNSPLAAQYFYNGPIAGYALFDGMTPAELLCLSNFFDNLNAELGRISNDVVVFGDSNAASTGVPLTARWAYRVASGLGACRSLVSATRARASNVATITFASPHLLKTGQSVSTIGFGGSGYNTDSGVAANSLLPMAQVTVVDATTITYPCIGSNEGQTADVAGGVHTGYVNLATNGSTVSYCPVAGLNGSASTSNRWTWPTWTTGVTPATRLAFLYRVMQSSGGLYVFNIGANDCAFKGDAVDFDQSYRTTMNQLVASGVPMNRLLLTSLMFGKYEFVPPAVSYRTEVKAVEYNAIIEKIAADYGCKYVNLYTLWDASNYATYMLDETAGNGGVINFIHANAAGCSLVAKAVLDAVSSL